MQPLADANSKFLFFEGRAETILSKSMKFRLMLDLMIELGGNFFVREIGSEILLVQYHNHRNIQ
jgi:hypothetical protein